MLLSRDGEVSRAISEIRKALGLLKCREPIHSPSLGGGRSHDPTDEAFIRTLPDPPSAGGVSYAFILNPHDTIDWIDCRGDIRAAAQSLSSLNFDQARQLAGRWENALLHADLETALSDTEVWEEVLSTRLRMLRVLGITAGARNLFGEVLDRASEVALQDVNNTVYDVQLAEAALRARFAIDATRSSGLAAIETFFYEKNLVFPPVIKTFDSELKDVRENWDVVRSRWFATWDIRRLETPSQRGSRQHRCSTEFGGHPTGQAPRVRRTDPRVLGGRAPARSWGGPRSGVGGNANANRRSGRRLGRSW